MEYTMKLLAGLCLLSICSANQNTDEKAATSGKEIESLCNLYTLTESFLSILSINRIHISSNKDHVCCSAWVNKPWKGTYGPMENPKAYACQFSLLFSLDIEKAYIFPNFAPTNWLTRHQAMATWDPLNNSHKLQGSHLKGYLISCN